MIMSDKLFILFNKTDGVIYGDKPLSFDEIADITHDRRKKTEWQIIPFAPVDLKHPDHASYFFEGTL